MNRLNQDPGGLSISHVLSLNESIIASEQSGREQNNLIIYNVSL